jgi:hypothetical protein
MGKGKKRTLRKSSYLMELARRQKQQRIRNRLCLVARLQPLSKPLAANGT